MIAKDSRGVVRVYCDLCCKWLKGVRPAIVYGKDKRKNRRNFCDHTCEDLYERRYQFAKRLDYNKITIEVNDGRLKI